MNKIIDGKSLSKEIALKLKKEVKEFMIKPSLVVIQIGNNEASNVYIKNKERIAKEIGINFSHEFYGIDASEEEIINKIKYLNNDEYTDGIIIQLPIPSKYNAKKIINTIISTKDVDGLTDVNAGRLINNRKCFIPCTPKGIIELFENNNIDLLKKHVVIVGRSSLVGKPLLSLLLSKDATITMCHSKTENLSKYTKEADILIVAVGKKHIIKKEMVKKDSVIIDVGINKEDNKLYGDVDFDDVIEKVSFITPVPGGVGPMTVISLMKNTITSYKSRLNSK